MKLVNKFKKVYLSLDIQKNSVNNIKKRLKFIKNSLQCLGFFYGVSIMFPLCAHTLINKNNILFYNLSFSFFYKFLLELNQKLYGINNLFVFQFELFGLGYKLNKIIIKNQRYLRVEFGYSHVIYLKIPISVDYFSDKKKIIIASFNFLDVFFLVNALQKFKPLNAYKLKGIKLENQIVKLKEGKRQNR